MIVPDHLAWSPPYYLVQLGQGDTGQDRPTALLNPVTETCGHLATSTHVGPIGCFQHQQSVGE